MSNSNSYTAPLPAFVAFGEALTDMLRTGPDTWTSVPGGAPWNAARVMAHFGVASAFGGAISQDCFGDALWQASAKAGLDLHAQATRLDGRPGLRIASLAPGVIDTAMQAQVRASDPADFPQQARFAALKADGQLSTPSEVAHKLVEHLLGHAFGHAPTGDLRTLPAG